MFTADQLRQQRGSSTPAPCPLPPPHWSLRVSFQFITPSALTVSFSLTPPVNQETTNPCTLQSLRPPPGARSPVPLLLYQRAHRSLISRTAAPRQLSKSPTSRQAGKPTSRQVGKLANPPLPFSLTRRVNQKHHLLPPATPHPVSPRARRLPISATLYLISPPLLPPDRPIAAKPTPSTRAGCPSFSPYPAGKPHPLQHLTRPNVPPCTRTRRVTFTLDHTHHYPPAAAARIQPPAPPPVCW